MANKEVMVFGAGPAGISAASHLTEAGYGVTLVGDKTPFRSTFTRVPRQNDRLGKLYRQTGRPIGEVHAMTGHGTHLVVPATEQYVVFDNTVFLDNFGLPSGVEVQPTASDVTVRETSNGVTVAFGNGRARRECLTVVDASGVEASIIHQVDPSRGSNFLVEAVYGRTFRGELDQNSIYLIFDQKGGTSWVCPSAYGKGLVDVVYTFWCWKSQFPNFLNFAPKGLRELVEFINTKLDTGVDWAKPEETYSGMIRTQPTRKPSSQRTYAIGEAAGVANPVSGDSWQRALLSGQLITQSIVNGESPQQFHVSWTKRWRSNGFMYGIARDRIERCTKGEAGRHIDWLGKQFQKRKNAQWFIKATEKCVVGGTFPLELLLSLVVTPSLAILALKALRIQFETAFGSSAWHRPVGGLIPES